MKVSLRRFFLLPMAVASLLVSCDSGDAFPAKESGSITFSFETGNVFNTDVRGLDEDAYKNIQNYTVQLFDVSGTELQSGRYDAFANTTMELPNGAYTLKAFYGKEHVASRDEFYAGGETGFSVQGDNKTVSVACAPTAARCAVTFDESMATYFSDYYVEFETSALKAQSSVAKWASGDSEPWYLKVEENEPVTATLYVTRLSDGKSTSVVRTRNLNPNEAWRLNISANYEESNGQIGITITIDESTNDQTVDVTVPSEWL